MLELYVRVTVNTLLSADGNACILSSVAFRKFDRQSPAAEEPREESPGSIGQGAG